MVLFQDNVQKEGFDSKMMRKFMGLRTGEFNPDLLDSLGFEIEDYQERGYLYNLLINLNKMGRNNLLVKNIKTN